MESEGNTGPFGAEPRGDGCGSGVIFIISAELKYTLPHFACVLFCYYYVGTGVTLNHCPLKWSTSGKLSEISFHCTLYNEQKIPLPPQGSKRSGG